jgi:site-specific DNA recombinase
VFTDNDVSTFSAKARPGFEDLLQAVKNGEADSVVVYHVDRLYRRLEDLIRLVEVVEVTGAQIHTVAAGDLDLATASGRLVARLLGSVAQHESERIAERCRVKHDELAGKAAAPGGRAPYGYRWEFPDRTREKGTYVVNDAEAAVVRAIADRVLAGASVLSISRELDAAGVATREGRPWNHSTVRAVLINPAVAGLRVHRRQVVGKGTWEPILDLSKWETVRATLTDPARKHTRAARKHLLSGLVVNELGERMNGSVSNIGNSIYSTRMPAQKSAQIPAVPLERVIVEAVLQRFDKTVLPQPATASNDAVDEVARLDGELAELAELRGTGEISLSEWMAARKPLLERLEAARKAVRPVARVRNADLLTQPGAVRKAWPALDFAAQRELLAAVIDRVVIGPATRGRWTPIDDRVDIVWKA